ncbi:HD domain-containing protein [Roseibacillus persicicus]|uniref:N-methyl-D-aspartate receptor NMDAR2C subunit n=1 Tax=Roseibacillus persicicus TaxID=454148 RepID=A0A918TW31_9BACT|nr:hypothetical protein [Roseibacillus persicicus]GHC63968.1 hypothetical protein GCM10007100_34460 [Roseibacillus persicicus]
MNLTAAWVRLCQAARFDNNDYFAALSEAYTRNSLAYHNLAHIEDCLLKYQKFSHLAHDPLAVEFAIWFHDIVYDPKARNNEEQSAVVAKEFLRGHALADSVAELILATRHQEPLGSLDAQLICDIDLSILGSDSPTYHIYAEAIREEYAWVAPDDYKIGRAKVLEDFLSRPRIYQHAEFRKKYERQARLNLKEELNSLSPA